MVEAPSYLARHTPALRVTLLVALLRLREREITDALVELLIATVHRIDARAQPKVTNELIAEFKNRSGAGPDVRRAIGRRPRWPRTITRRAAPPLPDDVVRAPRSG